MSELIATPVVKNKFWVVEDHGNKIATIQAREDGGFVYVHDDQREYFPSTKDIKRKFNIKFGSLIKKNQSGSTLVYGFPAKGKIFNQVFDVQRRLPIYTKLSKSKSLYCAGYYLIKYNDVWEEQFCPKNITLQRYQYIGPFKNKESLLEHFKELKNEST